MSDPQKVEQEQGSKISASVISKPSNLKFKKFTSGKPLQSAANFDLSLEKIIGITSRNSNSFVFNQQTNHLVYPTGSIANLYDLKLNKTIKYLQTPSHKAITSLTFSPDGRYLAIACKHPEISIWEPYSDLKTPIKILRGHRFGIEKTLFSPNMKYLVSIGDPNDKGLFVWDWQLEQRLTMNKISRRILSATFTPSGNYLITAGETHLKFWNFDASGNIIFGKPKESKSDKEPTSASSRDVSINVSDVSVLTTATNQNAVNVIEGKSASLGKMSDKVFMSVSCTSDLVYAVTQDGVLCVVNIGTRALEKWMDLKVTNAYAVIASSQWLICACGDGFIRFFKLDTLEHLFSLPKPPTLGSYNIERGVTKLTAGTDVRYADTIAIAFDEANLKLASLYSDRTLFIWDLKSLNKIVVYRSFLNHCGSINDMQLLSASSTYEVSFFVTGSVDKTMRIWYLCDSDNKENEKIVRRNVYCKNLSRIIYLSDNHDHFKNPELLESSQLCLQEEQIRCVRAPQNGSIIACGDQGGVIRIYSTDKFELVTQIKAHEQEVTCLDFAPKNIESANFLASGGRDRLINVYDIQKDYELLCVLDDHSSSIIALRVFYIRSLNKLGIVSCGADRSIVIRNYNSTSRQFELFHREVDKNYKTHSLDLSPDHTQFILGQDKRISVWEIETGKIKSSFETKEEEGGKIAATENMRVCVDLSGSYIASCHRDGSIRIRDYNTGQLVSKVHCGDFITGIIFCQNNKSLIAVTTDGCMFFWRLPEEMVSAINKKKSQLGIIVKKLREFMEEPNDMEGSLFKDFKFDSLIAEKELKEYISKQKEVGGLQGEGNKLVTELEKEDGKSSKLTHQEEEQNQMNKALLMGRQSIESASKMGISNFVVPSKLPDWAKSKIEDKPEKSEEPLFEKQPQVGGKWKERLHEKSLEIDNLSNITEKPTLPTSTKSTNPELEVKKVEEVKLESMSEPESKESTNPDKYDNMKIRDDLQFGLDDEFDIPLVDPLQKPSPEGAKKIEQPISFEKKISPTVSVPISMHQKTPSTDPVDPNKQSNAQPSHPHRSGISNPIKGKSLGHAHLVHQNITLKVNEQEIDLGEGLKIQVETVDAIPIMSSKQPISTNEQQPQKSELGKAQGTEEPSLDAKKSEITSRNNIVKEEAPRKRAWDKKPHEELTFPSKPIAQSDSKEHLKQPIEAIRHENLSDKSDGAAGQLISNVLFEGIQTKAETDENTQNTGLKYGDPFVNNLFSKDKPAQQDEEKNKGPTGGNFIKYKMKDEGERETYIDLDDIKGQISQINKNLDEIEKRNVETNQKSTVVDVEPTESNLSRNFQITNPFSSPEKFSTAGDQKQDSPSMLSQKPTSSLVMTPGQASVVSIDRKQLVPTTLEEIYKKRNETTNVSLNTSTVSPDRIYNIPDQKPSAVTNITRDKIGIQSAWDEKPISEGLDISKAEPHLADEIQASFNQIAKALEKVSHLLEAAPKDQIEKERTKLIQAVDSGLNDTRTNLNLLSFRSSNVLNTKFEIPSEGNMSNLSPTRFQISNII